MANKYRLTREEQMLTPEQKEKLRYFKNGKPKTKPKPKRMSAKEAKAMAAETGVTVEEIRAMEAEAANESSAADFSRSYKKGGMVTKANCGASMKPTQKSTAAVKMACGGMAYGNKKEKK